MEKILVVGVAGGTGSGKTTFANALAQRLGDDVVILAHDNYYRAHHDMSYDERTLLNYDHPNAYETDLMVRDLAALKRGIPVNVPMYDFSIHDRSEHTTTLRPAPVIVVEGIMVLQSPELRELMDIKIFVDAGADVRILRRTLRDVSERGRSIKSVITQYLQTVRPMHEQYVEPSKRHADLIVPSEDDFSVAVDVVAGHIRSCLMR